MRYRLRQSGETIIEVLIAIAVLSAALGGAFAISSKSRATLQSNQERYQAQVYANEQADLLRKANVAGSAAAVTINSYGANGRPFCMNANGTVSAQSSGPAVAPCTRGTGLVYRVFVTPFKGSDNSGTTVDTFLIKVEWDGFRTGNIEKVEVGYGT